MRKKIAFAILKHVCAPSVGLRLLILKASVFLTWRFLSSRGCLIES